MKGKPPGFLIMLLPFALLQGPVIPSRSAPSTWTPNDKLVAAYYFYWYDIYTGEHFIDPDGTDAITNHPPDSYLANYSYTEVSWHRRELLDMMAAQISTPPRTQGNEPEMGGESMDDGGWRMA
jgi:hypothetical protein